MIICECADYFIMALLFMKQYKAFMKQYNHLTKQTYRLLFHQLFATAAYQ